MMESGEKENKKMLPLAVFWKLFGLKVAVCKAFKTQPVVIIFKVMH